MNNSLIIVAGLALTNFLVFMALVVIIIKARHRYRGSSYKISSVKDLFDTNGILPKSSMNSIETQEREISKTPYLKHEVKVDMVCCAKCNSKCEHAPQEVVIR